MMRKIEINFNVIRAQVTAAEELQAAGKTDASEQVLRELARDIHKELGK